MDQIARNCNYIVVYSYFDGPNQVIGNIDYHSNNRIVSPADFTRMTNAVKQSVGVSSLVVTNVMSLPI